MRIHSLPLAPLGFTVPPQTELTFFHFTFFFSSKGMQKERRIGARDDDHGDVPFGRKSPAQFGSEKSWRGAILS